MNIPITDQSEPLKADVEVYVSGGVIKYKLNWRKI